MDRYFIEGIASNDYILLCTDGILENINEVELMEILGDQQKVTNKQALFLEYCQGKTDDMIISPCT